MRYLILIILTSTACCLLAQPIKKAATYVPPTLSGISSKWSDSFVEWEIFGVTVSDSVYTDEAEKIGELKQRWSAIKDDWTEWDFTYNDQSGTIKLKWKNDPSLWELRTYSGQIVTMKRAWPNDYTEWRVTDNTVLLTHKSRYTSQLDQWSTRDNTHGNFIINTIYENDPHDWAIDDQLDEDVSEAMRMALVFLTVVYSSPKQ
jgi:hypothetical protein